MVFLFLLAGGAAAQPAPAAISAQPPPEVSAAAAQVVAESVAERRDGDAGSETADGADGGDAGESAAAEEGPSGLTLADLLQRAADHPLVEAARADLNAADARHSQSEWAQWSNWNANLLFTFVPPAHLDLTGTHDDIIQLQQVGLEPQWNSSILDWGPWIRLGISGTVPIWTFGKITGLQDAAEAGVDASTVGVEQAGQQIAFKVRQAYLTLALARDILYLIDDGRGYIDDARSETQKRIDAGEGGGNTLDLYKIDAMSAEVDARELQAKHLERVALAGLRLLAGLDESQTIVDEPLEPFAVELRPEQDYVDLARRERPELRMLDAGIRAQRAKIDIELAQYYPDFAITAYASYAYSNVTDDVHNPWLNDPFNTSGVGGALVMNYPLDFAMDYYRVDEARAVLRRLEEQREALAQAAEAEVVDAYEALVEARGRIDAWDRGRLAAKRWMIAILQGMTLGLQQATNLTDALVAYFQDELSYLNAVYDSDMAWAKLAAATGGDFLDDAVFVEPE